MILVDGGSSGWSFSLVLLLRLWDCGKCCGSSQPTMFILFYEMNAPEITSQNTYIKRTRWKNGIIGNCWDTQAFTFFG